MTNNDVKAATPKLTEAQIVKCLAASGCIGTVKMSFESGPYDIDRPSINADRLVTAILAEVATQARPSDKKKLSLQEWYAANKHTLNFDYGAVAQIWHAAKEST